MSAASEEALLKAEIARLSGAIDRHKTTQPSYKSASYSERSNTYVNPNYKPPSKSVSRPSNASTYKAASSTRPSTSMGPRDVVINGIAFRSSGRSLVRKDVAKSIPTSKPPIKYPRQDFSRAFPGSRATQRPYKPRVSHRKPQNHNMTLTNGKKPVSIGRKSIKSMKHINKQCPRFSLTGVCSKGRICLYNHDPEKIAICWPFLQGKCPNSAETCSLSHEPTPKRTPLCVHFLKNGLCKNGENCLYPHVNVGPRSGVCRDFAVLGYCEKGIDCEQQHVRECPDFAEKGTCSNRACKLPHVIRANQRKAAGAPVTDNTANSDSRGSKQDPILYADDAQIGDEFISLTFHESSEESSDEEVENSGESGEDNSSDEDEDPDDIGLSVHI